jgi:hypothetical protein
MCTNPLELPVVQPVHPCRALLPLTPPYVPAKKPKNLAALRSLPRLSDLDRSPIFASDFTLIQVPDCLSHSRSLCYILAFQSSTLIHSYVAASLAKRRCSAESLEDSELLGQRTLRHDQHEDKETIQVELKSSALSQKHEDAKCPGLSSR